MSFPPVRYTSEKTDTYPDGLPNVATNQRWDGFRNRSPDVRMTFGLSGYMQGELSPCTAVPTDRRVLVSAANKQGKNVACIASAAGGSLWRPFGSEWRFRPLKTCAQSLYLCPQATGHAARFAEAVEVGSPAIRLPTDFYVRRNIARCVSSYSILFGLLPKTLPLQGAGLSLRSRAALISNLRLVTVRWLMSHNR